MVEQVEVLTERWRRFCDEYRSRVVAFVAGYKTRPNPSNPLGLFWTKNWDLEIMEQMGPEWILERRSLTPFYAARLAGWEDARTVVYETSHTAAQDLQGWFDGLVAVQLQHMPAAPDIDHDAREKLTFWTCTNGGKPIIYDKAVRIGQLVVVDSLWKGKRTYKVIVEKLGLSMPLTLNVIGSAATKKAYRERIFAFASVLSKATDWSTAMDSWVLMTACHQLMQHLQGEAQL